MESATKNKQTDHDILKMVQKAFGDEITIEHIAIKELTEGFYNVAYEVVLQGQPIILKIAPPRDAKIMSYEHNIMKAEVEALQLVSTKTKVPVPKVLYYDNSHSIIGSDYFFMEKIEGDSFFGLKNKGLLPYETQKKIYYEMGRFNQEMNQIKAHSFGYLGMPEKQKSSWKEVFLTMIEDVLLDGEKIEIDLTVPYIEVRDLIQKASASLVEVTTPSFVHWDLWDGNVFIHEDKISGIIDFERAMWADPLMEFDFRGHVNIKEFYDGYGENLSEKAPIRSLLYDMYLFLIMIIETKYRMYPDDWQYGFATKQLHRAMEELKKLV